MSEYSYISLWENKEYFVWLNYVFFFLLLTPKIFYIVWHIGNYIKYEKHALCFFGKEMHYVHDI